MTGRIHDVSGQKRKILWDEENRIRSISDNGAVHHYTYDASGERVLKGKSNGQVISIWLSVDPLAEQMPMWSSYNYTFNNPINLVDPDGRAPSKWPPDLGLLWKNYEMDGQSIIKNIGGRLSQFEGQNTCAIRMSYMLNRSGYDTPHPYLGIDTRELRSSDFGLPTSDFGFLSLSRV
jgi:YD repeat-containing protein